jgi:SAM-dependent methyltransferase
VTRADVFSLETLPYDSGVFDMVHIRFVALGVPEAKWSDLLDECTRVLRPGGLLEIVETSLHLPLSSPASLRNSFASMLLADMVSPLPSLPIKFALPLVSNLRGGTTPIFERTWDDAQVPGALGDAVMGWVKSAREYKGTGTGTGTGTRTGTRKGRRDRVVEKVRRELAWANENKWMGFKGDGDGVSNASAAAAAVAVPGSPFEIEADEAKKTAAAGAGVDGEVSVWAWVAVKK